MTVWTETSTAVPADHPCLAGHFPGNPIVPGTLILDRVISRLSRRYPRERVGEVIIAKFLKPLRPGTPFQIHYHEKAGQVIFECRVEDVTFTTGKLALANSGPDS
ncbi:MAG: hydroxymyristoyl-ACP dehydratase [Candidatus Thiodiazotropha sp. (ex Dulcina madagascariensis)]|nr:hydroxymyristoyl-ACP dehydratase [Candidatus Thiodiazotropha sp. (ex Dulcina madagascariensis)]